MLGVVSLDTLPPPDLPEIAFAGRSNVGKSSLINALTGRKALARASNEPGRTRELNFFDLGGRLRIVDLPGYGFAKAPKPVVERWTRLTQDYLRGRVNLKRVLLLIDARHGLKAVDDGVMKALDEAAVSYQIVLTKADKLKPGEAAARATATSEAIKRRPAAFPVVALTSSAKGDGIPELRAAITQMAQGGAP
jgi:GTP-binding protein